MLSALVLSSQPSLGEYALGAAIWAGVLEVTRRQHVGIITPPLAEA